MVLDAGELRIPGEVLHAPLRLPPLRPGHFHLYVPSAAAEVGSLLQAEAPELAITDSPAERHLAERFVLYLNGATWSAPAGAALQAEVEEALAAEMPLLPVHEQREHGHGAVPFGTIISRTPPALLQRDVYASLAVPLYDGGEHQRVSLRMMLCAPAAEAAAESASSLGCSYVRQAASALCVRAARGATGLLARLRRRRARPMASDDEFGPAQIEMR